VLLDSMAVVPGRLVGTDESVPVMPSHPQRFPDGLEPVVKNAARGDWSVDVPGHDRPLQVYQLGPADWPVSDVGRRSEGRGGALSRALAALFAVTTLVVWGRGVADALDADEEAR
jgi:hypothetical protein